MNSRSSGDRTPPTSASFACRETLKNWPNRSNRPNGPTGQTGQTGQTGHTSQTTVSAPPNLGQGSGSARRRASPPARASDRSNKGETRRASVGTSKHRSKCRPETAGTCTGPPARAVAATGVARPSRLKPPAKLFGHGQTKGQAPISPRWSQTGQGARPAPPA